MSTFGKKCLIALSLAALSTAAAAYVIPDNAGFVSRTQLIKAAKLEYDTTQGYTIVDLDGVRIYDSGDGFGPARVYEFYTCRNNILAQYCPPSSGGYRYY